MEYYKLQVCGLTRNLPLIAVGRHTKMAALSILGDIELVDALTEEMAKKILKLRLNIDFIVGPEVKAVPLVHGIAKKMGHKRFVICRKSIKPYMISPLVVKPLNYFPKHSKPLVLNGTDAELLKGKKVFVVDDVISTGVTFRMIGYLMKKIGAEVVGYITAVKQGEQFDKFENLISLVNIPIFRDIEAHTTPQ